LKVGPGVANNGGITIGTVVVVGAVVAGTVVAGTVDVVAIEDGGGATVVVVAAVVGTTVVVVLDGSATAEVRLKASGEVTTGS
jgi:hypothetical protein